MHACTVYLHIYYWARCMYELICPPLLLFYWNFSFIQYSEIMEQIDRDVKCTTLTCISSVQMPIAVSSTKLVRNKTITWVINPNYFPGSNYCLQNCEHNPCWNLCKFSCIWFMQVWIGMLVVWLFELLKCNPWWSHRFVMQNCYKKLNR